MKGRPRMVKWELDLWYEMWDRAGSQGLDTWYNVKGRLKDENELSSVRGPNIDGLDGTTGARSQPACDGREGE
jgi:hypothetical protein